MLDAVYTRAGAIRRRRRMWLSSGLGAAVVLVLGAAAVLAGGDGGSSHLRVAGPGATAVFAPVTTTTVPDTTTSIRAAETTTTRIGTGPATTARTSPSTATAPTTAPSTTSSTTATFLPPLPSCQPGDVVVTATPDRPTYPAGTTVNVLVAATNRSSRACQPVDPSLEIHDRTGATMVTSVIADAFTLGDPGRPQPSWDPGKTLSISMSWSGSCIPTPTCPPGTYSAVAVFGPFRSAAAPFTITA